MENYFFLILVAVVGLIRWLSQAAENKRNAETTKRNAAPLAPSSSPAPARGAPQTEEERTRKFLEALGVPTTNTPPPRVEPRPITPRPAPAGRKILPVDPFPLPRGRVNEPRPPVLVAPPPLPSVIAPVEIPSVMLAPVRMSRVATEFEVQEVGAASVPTKSDTAITTLAARLATPQGLREAMVLREIFGPPRSIQPLAHRAVV